MIYRDGLAEKLSASYDLVMTTINQNQPVFDDSYKQDIIDLILEKVDLLNGIQTCFSNSEIKYECLDNVLKKHVKNGDIHWQRYAHSRNVSDLAKVISNDNDLEVAGILHDIGKYFISEINNDVIDNPIELQRHKLKHIIMGQTIITYLLQESAISVNFNLTTFNSIVYHHDANPFYQDNPIHVESPSKGVSEQIKVITFADSCSALSEPFRTYNGDLRTIKKAYFQLTKEEAYAQLRDAYNKNPLGFEKIQQRINKINELSLKNEDLPSEEFLEVLFSEL